MKTQVNTIWPILNGIDTVSQEKTLKAVSDKNALGETRFCAINRWRGGTQTRSGISTFDAAGTSHSHMENFEVDTDLPQGFLGTDQAPAPTEYALQSLAACMTTTMVYNCAARGIEVRSVESKIEGEMNAAGFFQLNKKVRNGFSQVRVRFNIDADASDEELQQLLESSPLFDVFSNGVPVEVELSRA